MTTPNARWRNASQTGRQPDSAARVMMMQARITPAASSALRVAAIVSLLALICLMTFVPLGSNDVWLQAKIGEIIVTTGSIPTRLLFPFAWIQSNRFNAHEWLPSIVFHLVDRTLGLNQTNYVTGGFGLLLFGGTAALAKRLADNLAIGLMAAGAAMVVANYRSDLRPELFGLVLMVALLHVLWGYQQSRRRRRLLWSIPIAVLWANCHGSFVLGPVLAALFFVGELVESLRGSGWSVSWRQFVDGLRAALPYGAAAFGMTLASLVNPLGAELLRFAVALSSSEVTRAYIDEWKPTLSPEFIGRPFFVAFAVAALVSLAVALARRRRLTATDVLLLVAFGALALQRIRFMVFFGFVAFPVCARLLHGAWQARKAERVLFGTIAAVSAIGIAVVVRFGNMMGAYPYASPSYNFTEPMIRLLARPEMQGNVFNSYALGAELIYRAYPRLRPSIDSRIDSYGDQYFLLQDQLLRDEYLLDEFIADFDIRYMLIYWREFEQLKKMESLQKNWKLEFADHKMVLLRRSGPPVRLPPSAPTPRQTGLRGSHP
ncbi:MAG TPA: hypothetical protein VNU71_01850 [Burkholderiaceae bacterium]|nr:hypothetical protein [Burkholderiaceae bacterium]